MTAPDPAWVEAGAKALTAGKSYGGWVRDEDAWKACTLIAEKVIAAVEPLIRAQYDEWVTPEQHEAVVAVTKVRTERWVREQTAKEIEMRCQQIHHGSGDCPHCGPIIRMIRIKEE